jgi:DNA-binding SARP family transcriptional activator
MSDATPQSLSIHLFGAFRLRVDDKPVEGRRWSRPRPKLIVKLLALQPHHQLHREQVMDILWPELGPDAAARNLSKAIHVVRHALEPGLNAGGDSRFIVAKERQVMLTAPGKLWVDVEEFQSLAAAAMGSQNPADYEAALNAYQGDLLIEDLYEDWTAGPRERLRQLRQDLLARLAGLYEARGDYARGISVLTKLLADDPSNEEAHRGVMRLHALTGNRRQAMRQYRLCSEVLRAELGEEPQSATVELFDQIASGQLLPAPRRAAAPTREPGNAIDSLAVLPFLNISRDSELEYLSDGLTESSITCLSQRGGLRVMARSTVFR